MQHSEIIKTAWTLTRSHKGLIWYGVFPAFFSTIVGISYVLWQIWAFETSPFFGGLEFDYSSIVGMIFTFLQLHAGFFWFLVVVLAVGSLAYVLMPPICEGAIVGLTAALYRGKDVKMRDGIGIGMTNFLRLFEYRMLISIFSLVEFFAIFSLALRYFGPSTGLFVVFGIIFFVSLLIYFLFLYTEILIILEKRSVLSAMTSSASLVVSNLEHTFLMFILMLLIVVRVVINVLLLFLIPALVIFVTGFFLGQAALTLGIILGGLAGLLVLLLSAYLAGTLHVFTSAAWTLTFLSLDHERLEKLTSA